MSHMDRLSRARPPGGGRGGRAGAPGGGRGGRAGAPGGQYSVQGYKDSVTRST